MQQYYFLMPSLPLLKFGEEPDISFEELLFRLRHNLNKKEWESIQVIRRLIDIANIRKLLLGEPLDPRGNLSEKELDEALLIRGDFTDCIYEFLNKYESKEDRLHYFSELLVCFFKTEIPKHKGFIREYLTFERALRIVLTAMRCKKMGRDVAQELQFEDFSDEMIAQVLAQKDAVVYEPPQDFMEVKEIMQNYGDNPLSLHKKIEQFRFKKVAEMSKDVLFGVEAAYSYTVLLIIIENWNMLSKETGATKLRDILDTELKK